jgi:predicted phosphoadenosine phosphosulfate sulfurtransferase
MLHYEQRLETDTYLQKFEREYNKIYSRFYRADGKLASERSGKDMTRG